MDLKSYENSGVAYFAKLPKLIQEQVIEHGIPIDSKPQMENFYQNILHSGPTIIPMNDEK
ncbi:hypothetical protein [Scatolibacter rhodanostii]|uniref:hypothetical protein n=1 Tax=Scatolibacter rhodanostii TaxID=2014781 RepID=UPI000C07D96F|nr:hypothetical protein [Scatolibacter rhodanostii]